MHDGTDRLHSSSARGPAVSAQATPSLAGAEANFYQDTSAWEARRPKPDLVAPGVNVLSARASGASESGEGYDGSSCSTDLIALSGTSASAAVVRCVCQKSPMKETHYAQERPTDIGIPQLCGRADPPVLSRRLLPRRLPPVSRYLSLAPSFSHTRTRARALSLPSLARSLS